MRSHMLIRDIEAIPVSVPRIPEVNIVGRTGRTIPNAEFVVVVIRTDEGIEGIGEAPVEVPWTGEDASISKHCIDRHLAPAVLGQDPVDIHRILGLMERAIPWHPYSKGAIEM